MIFIPITLPVFYRLKYPLVIYEEGFDEPVPVLKSKEEERFVPFSEVKNIYPEYSKIQGPLERTGLTVLLSSGKKVKIQKSREKELDEMVSSFRRALGDRWKEVYIDRPYLGMEEIRDIKNRLSKPKGLVYGAGAMAVIVPFVILLIGLWTSIDDFTLMIFFAFVMVSAMFGMNIIMKYKKAEATYEQVSQRSPEKTEEVFQSIDIDVEEDQLKSIERYTHDDWKKLQKEINTNRYLYMIIIGVALFGIGVVGVNLYNGMSLIGLIALGLLLMHLPLYFGRKQRKKKKLVSEIIEEELKNDRSILPDWFEIKTRWNVPIRDTPKYPPVKWKKLVSASRVISPVRMAIFMSVTLAGMAAFLVSVIFFDLNLFLLLGVMMVFWLLHFSRFFLQLHRKNILEGIMDYEEMSGERVIPDEFRDDIYRGWISE
ncbi:MAG: hypothetical protein ACLFSM_00720 [Thermoplasmata archaeon]